MPTFDLLHINRLSRVYNFLLKIRKLHLQIESLLSPVFYDLSHALDKKIIDSRYNLDGVIG